MRAKLPLMVIALALLAGTTTFAQPDATDATLIIAQARWPGQDLSRANFYVFADAGMKDLVDVFPSGGPGGAAFIGLRAGEYYIMVIVDVNASGKTDEGDGFGWYGVEDLAPSSRPQPLVITDEPGAAIAVRILLTRTAEGKLLPLPGAPRGKGTLKGRLTGTGVTQACVILRADPDARTMPAALADPDGSFEIIAQAGGYELLAYAEPGPAWRVVSSEVQIAADLIVDLGELAPGVPVEEPDALPALLVGTVVAPELPEGAAVHVQVCADANMQGAVATVQAADSGLFVIAIESATYYLRAIVGDDAAPGPGDLLGFYGVADLTGEDRPQPLDLTGGQVRADVTIPIVARIAEDGTITAVIEPGE